MLVAICTQMTTRNVDVENHDDDDNDRYIFDIESPMEAISLSCSCHLDS